MLYHSLHIVQTLNYAFPHRLSAGICVPVRVRDHGHVRGDLEVSQNIARRLSHGGSGGIYHVADLADVTLHQQCIVDGGTHSDTLFSGEAAR